MTVFRPHGYDGVSKGIAPKYIGYEFTTKAPKTIRALTKAFMKFRAAKLAADPSVDTFFNRGESAARFAYFDE